MMFRTHLAFGFLIGFISLNFVNVPNVYVYLALVCIASVIPDIDSSDSKVGKKVKPFSWLLEKIFGHRNLFHSVFPPIILFIIFYFFLNWNVAAFAIFLGYMAHLITDMLTRMGIAFFYPVWKKRIAGFIKTGSVFDYALFFIFVGLSVALVLGYISV